MLAQRPCAAGKDGRKTKNRPGPVCLIGRGGGIRTRDPLHPMQVRYQAALRPDEGVIILGHSGFCSDFEYFGDFL